MKQAINNVIILLEKNKTLLFIKKLLISKLKLLINSKIIDCKKKIIS